jgi:methionyl-tRNA formyltransferase
MLVEQYFPGGLACCWQQGDQDTGELIRAELLSRKWELCISFYNDYIFSGEEIDACGCMVNIHPALPHLRGRGYDIIPLLQKHREHGATLHFVRESIDAGPIIDVLVQNIPDGIDYQKFRSRNQMLSLNMLERLLWQCRTADATRLFQDFLDISESRQISWSGEFVNSRKLARMLLLFKMTSPEHPIFSQIPASLLQAPLDFPTHSTAPAAEA